MKKEPNKNDAARTNMKINEEFNKGNEFQNVDEEINKAFYPDKQKNDSNPTSYLFNNTPAIDVTGNKDEDR